jgi:phosphoribosylformimino-5-aminoimidazole carboxamide ribotide isomerase
VLIVPAIDLRAGRCVRLRQGDYAQETVFDDDPITTARRWVEDGAQRLHLVDLDGAREGKLVNGDAIQAITKACGVPCQLGGGLRTDDTIARAFSWGVGYVILGTRAVQDFAWAKAISEQYPGRILVAMDARAGQVSTHGWTTTADQSAAEFAKAWSTMPIAGLIHTDIERDGMLSGPNFDAYKELVGTIDVPVFASGGITTADDVAQLREIGVRGCIIGRALYEGQLKLPELIHRFAAPVV